MLINDRISTTSGLCRVTEPFLGLSRDVAIIAGCLYTAAVCGGGLRLPGASVGDDGGCQGV